MAQWEGEKKAWTSDGSSLKNEEGWAAGNPGKKLAFGKNTQAGLASSGLRDRICLLCPPPHKLDSNPVLWGKKKRVERISVPAPPTIALSQKRFHTLAE